MVHMNLKRISLLSKRKDTFSLRTPRSTFLVCLLVFGVSILIEILYFILNFYVISSRIYLGSWALIVGAIYCLDILDLSENIEEMNIERIESGWAKLSLKYIVRRPRKRPKEDLLELFFSGIVFFLKLILVFISSVIVLNYLLVVFF